MENISTTVSQAVQVRKQDPEVLCSEPRSLIREDLFTAKTSRGCERGVQGALGVIVDPREEVTFTLLAE